MEELESAWHEDLLAILPAEQGSRICFKNHRLLLTEYTPAVVLHQWARQLGIDLALTKRYLRRLLNRRMVPLPLLPNLTLVPLPVRRGPGPLWGYVVFEEVLLHRRLNDSPFRSAVYLEDGTIVATLAAAGQLRQIWREAQAAKKALEQQRSLLPPTGPPIRSSPASRPYTPPVLIPVTRK